MGGIPVTKIVHLYPYNGEDHVLIVPDDEARKIFEAKRRGEQEIMVEDERGNGAIIDLSAYRCIEVRDQYAGDPMRPRYTE